VFLRTVVVFTLKKRKLEVNQGINQEKYDGTWVPHHMTSPTKRKFPNSKRLKRMIKPTNWFTQ
jgi:hypothetical protein